MEVDGTVFSLRQFHFHTPSEHTINGEHSALEMHLVHQTSDGALGVIGVMIRGGPRNEAFVPIWGALQGTVGEEQYVEDTQVHADYLLPDDRAYYRYDGSLTTPPCTEGVTWFVLQSPIEISGAQIRTFENITRNNIRPVQPLNGRVVIADAAME